MKFRQNSFVIRERIISLGMAFLCGCWLMFYDKKYINLLLFPTILILLVMIACPIIDNKYIVIDEKEIALLRKNHVLWRIELSEIREFKKSARFHSPSLEIVLKGYNFNHPKGLAGNKGYYFQLSKKAKQAIKEYCSSIEIVT